MKTLYTDASFSPQGNASNGENIVRGKIAVVWDGGHKIDKVAIGRVDGLKQYNNVLELTALARAIELACEDEVKPDSLKIYTDSRTAMIWASNGRIKDGVRTLAHENALEYLKKVRHIFGGIVTFNFIGREGNPAGKLLEGELEKERSYTV